MIPKLDHLYFVNINKLLYLKTFTRYKSKLQMLRAVVPKALSLSQQHQYYLELVRNSNSQSPPQTY